MNNKGFTLIELVAIISVLAAIFLVSFPAFKNMTKADQEKQYDDMINNLCLAGKSYIYSHIDSFEDRLSNKDGQIVVNVIDLILYGNIEEGIVNPKTGEVIDNDSLKYTVLADFSLDCEYNDI